MEKISVKSESSNYIKGVCYILISALCFALMAASVRLSGDVPFVQKTFFRNLIAFLIAFCALIVQGNEKGFKTLKIPGGSLKFLFLRSICGTLGIFGNFYAIDHLILSDASILNKMSPFFSVISCFFLLGESIPLIPMMAIITAFGGAMLVVKPSFDFSQNFASFAGLVSGIGAGIAYASIRKLGTLKCNGKVIIAFFSLFSMMCSIPFMLISYEPMSLYQTSCLIMAGVFAAGGQFTITAAYFAAPASKISIFDYFQVIFAAGLGFLLFGQKADILSIIGYAVIISMAIVNFIYNRKKLSASAVQKSEPSEKDHKED